MRGSQALKRHREAHKVNLRRKWETVQPIDGVRTDLHEAVRMVLERERAT